MKLYYIVKPFLPRSFQIFLRRQHIRRQRARYRQVWPIDPGARTDGPASACWPQGRFAFVLTHDVDTGRGQDRCRILQEIEAAMGFRSSFNFVPERYAVDPGLRAELTAAGFEVGVHGLNHDGRLYSSRAEFDRRAVRINRYLKEWGSVGFRSPAMHHNLEWLKALDIEYDASTFDTDPFEPQPDGVGTIFPFWVAREDGTGYVEIPYTLPQDHLLFVLMREKSIDIWKKKLDWIAEKGGMALINTHGNSNFVDRIYRMGRIVFKASGMDRGCSSVKSCHPV